MKKVPMRKCIACMKSMPKKNLLRIVKNADNTVLFDKTGKLNGRGLYICSMECLNKAVKTKRMNSVFEMNISEDNIKNIVEDVSEYLQNH